MSELKITINQLKNYLGTELKMRIGYKTIERMKVENSDFLFDSIIQSTPWVIWTHDEDFVGQFNLQGKGFMLNQIKPICYRLSDLDKFIPELGLVPLKRILNNDPELDSTIEIELIEGKLPFQKRFRVVAWIDYPNGESRKDYLADFYLNGNVMIPFSWMEQLFQWHFWPFGDEYFEDGLIIDKLKNKQNEQ